MAYTVEGEWDDDDGIPLLGVFTSEEAAREFVREFMAGEDAYHEFDQMYIRRWQGPDHTWVERWVWDGEDEVWRKCETVKPAGRA